MTLRRLSGSPLLNCAAAGLTALLSAAPAFAAVFSATPAADAFVASGPEGNLAGNNYGAAGGLSVSAAGLAKGEQQSVMQFDLSGALSSFNSTFGAGGWTVASVTLQLTAASPNNAIFNTAAAGLLGVRWMQNDSWQEGGGTPNAPSQTGITLTSLQSSFTSPADESLGTFSFNGATSGTFTVTLGLTPGFTADLLAGGNVSLRLQAADNAISALFNSRSFATAANRPTLTIEAVPEPGAAGLCGAGVLLVTARRRRIRSC